MVAKGMGGAGRVGSRSSRGRDDSTSSSTSPDFFDSPGEARQAAIAVGLSPKDYAETLQLTWDVADVCGTRVGERGWYVKLTVERDEETVLISFHPLERPLRTRGGTVKP